RGRGCKPEVGTDGSICHQFPDVRYALIARTLEFLQGNLGCAIGGEKLLCAGTGVPLRLEFGQRLPDLLEADAIGALVRSCVRRKSQFATGNHGCDDLREVAYAVVVSRLADVESLIEDMLLRRLGGGDERA